MKRKRFTEEQIVLAMRQSTPGGDVHKQAVASLAAIERQKSAAHGGGQ
jgi:hypothetical protein